MSKLLEKIKSRGYWKVVIHPATFQKKRVENIAELYPILEKCSVELRGWDFPHLDTHVKSRIDLDWIEQEPEWEGYLEIWRFYQSGQFVDYTGIHDDWRDQSNWLPAPNGWKPGATLYVEDAIFRYSEFFEFASRLSMTQAGDEFMHLEITIARLKGRTLQLGNRNGIGFFDDKVSNIEEFPFKLDITRTELISNTKELALKPAQELFRRFGWDASLGVLKEFQEELLGRGRAISGRR